MVLALEAYLSFRQVDILLYLIGFSSVLYNKELLGPIRTLVKDKVDI